MDTRSPFFQNIALVLIGILFLDPIVATAAQLAVDQAAGGNTQLGQAGNGVPVVNIATPNGSGLSHNKFSEYNVGQQGLILNNATSKTQATQLGGLIIGNPNLKGQAASTILNEVTGGNRSHLGGYTEVAGQSARVIVANPHGLTCNGCGFINIPRASMTTGKPIIESGRLERFQVDGGDIAIEGAGLNAGNVEQFDLITRSAKLNAELHAQQLNVIAGRNDVQADSLAATPRAGGEADKPQLAIDSSVLGGMYAGAIRLVGTEAGVGVKLAGNMAASAGDIQIDANGQLTLAQTAASGDLRVNAQSAELTGKAYAGGNASVQTRGALTNHQSLATGGALQLSSGGQLTNAGIVEAGVNPDHSRNPHGDIQVTARDLRNSGSLVASRNLQATASGTLDNRGGTLSAQGQAKVSADKLDNSQKGRVLAKGSVDLAAGQLQNGQGGVVTSNSNLDARVGHLDNRGGEVSSQQIATLTVDSLDNRGGRIIGEQALDLAASGSVNNQGGTLGANQQVKIKAGTLDNSQQGRISSQGGLDLKVAGTLHNQAGGQIGARGNASVSTGALDNSQSGQLTSNQKLQLDAGQVENRTGGRIASNGALNANVTGLDQRDGGQLYSGSDLSLDLNHGQLDNSGGLINAPGQLLLRNLAGVANRGGEISSQKGFILAAESLDNTGGKLLSNQALTLRIDRALDNLKGLISAAGVDARAGALNNGQGLLTSSGDLQLGVAGALINLGGELSSSGATRIDAASLDNRAGDILGDTGLAVDVAGAVANQGGTLGTGGALELSAGSLDNSQQGSLVSDGSLTLRVSDRLDNQAQGTIAAKGDIDVRVGSLDNRGGRVSGQRSVAVSGQQIDNRAGAIQSAAGLSLDTQALDNSRQGLVSSKGGMDLDLDQLDNQAGLISAAGPLALKARGVQNAQGRIASQNNLSAKVGNLNQQGGELVALGKLGVTADTLDNRRGGLVGATDALDLKVGELDNRGGEISSQAGITLAGQGLDNSDGGKILAGEAFRLTVERILNHAKGLIFGHGGSRIDANHLDNSGGTLASQQALAIALSDRSAHDPRLDGALTNQQGLISSEGTLTVDVSQLGNQAGTLSSAGDLKVSSTGLLDNRAGAIVTDAALVLTSNRLDNSLQGRLSAKGNAQVSTSVLDNSQGGSLTSAGDLELKAERVSNSGKGRIASGGDLNAVVASLNQQDGGELFSKASLSLDLQQGLLDNSNGGLINAPGQLLLKNLGMVFNQGGEISSQQGFTLVAHQLDNNGGKLLSNQPLVLRIAQALDNVKGSISAARLQLDAGHLDNSGGRVSSTGNFDLKVAGLLNNQDGELVALERLDLEAASLDNRQNGLVGAVKGLSLAVDDLDNRDGEISSRAGATLSGQRLDNSGGKLLADGSLALAIDQVINQAKGLVSGKAGLSLTGAQLTNDGGTLSSLQGVTLNLSERFSNQWGLVNSEGALGIQAGTLDNSHGVLSSAGPLSLESLGALTNQGGQVVTDGSLDLRSASLDNRQGLFSAQGTMEVQTGTLDNRQGGRLIGGDTFSLIAGEVDNSAQGRIGSAKALDARVTGLDQHDGGQLFSQADLSLDLQGGDLDNGNGGLINAPGQLLLNNLGHVANQGGEISSQQAFTLAARSLDNSRGKLLSAQALTLRIEQALSNLKGLIAGASLDARATRLDNGGGTLSSRGDLDLRAQALLNGQQGLINAAQALRLTASNLDNRGGSVLAGTSLDVTADSLDNSDQGLINSQGRLTLASTQQLTNNGGEISAKGELALSTGQFTQRQGRLIGESGLTLDLKGGDLDNQGGLILARGPLRLEHLRDLTNQGGEISSVQGFALNLRHLDNRGGKLISNDQLGLTVATANNQGGLLSGWQGLQLTGQSLDNSARGTLSSRSGDVTVKLQGALQNSGEGALVSQGKLDVQAASLDNHDKGILSSGGAQKLAVTGLLDNRNGGLVDSASDLDLSAATLANAGGRLAAEGNLNLTATATDLDNSAGSIATNGSATLSLLGVLTNTGGTLASRGPLTLQRAAQVNNQGGQIASQGLLTLLTGGLDNRNGGTLAANGALLLSASGAVQNSGDGLIYSRDAAVTLSAASLDNDGGTLQSQGDLKLTATGAVSNLGGQLISRAGNVDLSGNTLDNRGGTLASLQGWVKARLDGWLNNGTLSGKGGILQAQSLDLAAASLDNRGGHVSALSGAALLNVGHVDNGQGGLFAKQALKVTGTSLANGGQIAGGRVDFSLAGALDNQNGLIESASTLALAAATLDNRSGQLRALGTSGRTELNVQGLFDNRGGVLESANTEFGLVAASFLNTSGKVLHVGSGAFDVAMAHVTNAGGSLVTRGALTLTADSWTNSSVLQAGSLTVNVGQFTQTASGQLLASNAFTGRGGNWANDGLIASDGVFSLNLSGTYSGNGRLSSLGDLGLTANQLLLPTAGRITGGGTTTLNIDGPLTNHGRITSASDLTVNSGALSNFGTLGSASQLRLVTPTLLNENGLIFSGADMALRVGSFTNRYADVYSLGALDLAANDAGTRSAALENISATLESAGDMHLAAASIVNRKDFFSVSEQLQSGTIKFQCIGCYNNKYSSAYYYVDERIERTVTADSAASVITSGGNLGVISESFHNQHSLVSAAGDIKIDSSSFLNEGASTESVVRSRTFLSPREGPEVFSELVHGGLATYNKYNSLYVHQYGFKQRPTENNGQIYSYYGPDKQITDQANPDFNPTAHYGVPDRILGYTLVNSSETSTNSGVAANAIIQAGGNVSIQASSSLGNGVSHSNVAYAGGTNRVSNTAVDANTGGTVQINSQLPPDLAQQQVNPLALPGFKLPSGENGLFRLSGQGGSAAEANTTDGGPQQWTMGGASIGLAQREQQLPNTQAREVQVNGSGQTSTGQLGLGDRQLVTGASASQVQVQVGGPAEMGNLPGRTQVEGSMSQGPGVAPQPGDKPTSAGHLTVDRVQGLPGNQVPPKPHKYLVETNPELTSLKQFLSSDYLLGQLGYDPDRAQKRLGDGLYEQRLVREAIANRTGQRFLSGLNSDEAMFRHLMDNAIASKQQLGLSVGVSLSAAQVAALTHDIVWMEEHVVNGEKVLVPVLYLAHANNRLAPNGALIQGQDVTLIAGGELSNQGTLRASNNLSASGQNLNNAGLIEAGDRVSLLATDSIRNAQGGLIAGRDVSAIALTGDIVNERTVTEQRGSGGGFSWQTSVADNAARIEAANDLSLSAGRDLSNLGGVLSAGGNASLSAGRDLTLGAATEVDHREGQGKRWQVSETTVTQHGSEVKVGGDLKVEAGRDLAVIASQVSAGRDIDLAAGRDLDIASAANESHFASHSKRKGKQLDIERDRVRQQGSLIDAGGDFTAVSGRDLTLTASQVKAGDEAYLYAGNDLSLLAAEDSDYSLYDKKKKGSFGSKQTQRDEVTDIRTVGSSITTGGDLSLVSEGDQRYQGAKLQSGKDLTLDSGGAIAFEAVKDLHQESHEKSKSDLAWTSAKGKGTTDETVRQSELVAQGELAIHAVDGLKVDLKHIDQQTVSQTIDAMVQADPNLAWIKALEQRGDVDWRRVKEVHDSFKYSHSGLGAGAQLAIAIVMAAVVGPAAGAAVGGGTSGAIAGAVAATAATKGSVSLVNNQGDLGAVLKDVTSKESLKDYVVAGATAGLTADLFDKLFGTQTNTLTDKVSNVDLSTLEGVGSFAGNQLAQSGTAAALNKLMGRDPSFKDALQSALYNTLAAAAFNAVGDFTENKWVDGPPQKVAIHAIVGGLLSEATGGDFKTGAIAAGANEALVTQLDALVKGDPNLLTMSSQLVGLVAAAAVDGDVEKGAWVAQNATQYNYLTDHEMQALARELRNCEAAGTCDQIAQSYFDKHETNEAALQGVCDGNSTTACQAKAAEIYNAILKWQQLGYYAGLEGQPAKILQAFHQLNLAASPTATAGIAAPSASAFVEALGLNPESAAGIATAKTLASIVAGKASAKGGMLGQHGVQTASKTIWRGQGKERLDVENPNPGQRPGQIHYQDNIGNKYLYDPASKTFLNAPKSVNLLLNDKKFSMAIEKGIKKYLGE
ncbi:filamentous hemagglutinin N-terminal domain-containing protein [Pseudomonas sp. BN102]|uniref:two-partner secretion domain-containing protein n=1 Tax=Pseudomonas sp. BN102 TaxID=2567886 RepID=UPI002454210E|nr:filamentous hemagglutinin N-terminal domain-containing protein [Pseudomonas sp. BN102]MDH4610372.1 filamentous hemagglutinin N-terminal domain-containing protein [Pseudomonas sp. BN102]